MSILKADSPAGSTVGIVSEMSLRYSDVKIPNRSLRSGKKGRSSLDGEDAHSRWEFISQEELFGTSQPGIGNLSGVADRGDADLSEDMKHGVSEKPFMESSDPFQDLLRMTGEYYVTEEHRRDAFIKQARRMESYEEEGGISVTFRYHAFVGYQEMDTKELHNYFRWRTQFRRDEEIPPCESFLFLHAAELINLIGVSSEQEAFDRLLRLVKTEKPGVLQIKLSALLAGFVIAWNPGPDIVQEYCVLNPERESALVTLCSLDGSDDASVFRMLRGLTDRRTLNSEFVRDAGEDVWRVAARVFRRVCRMQEKSGVPVLAERILGRRRSFPKDLFSGIPYETRVEEGYCVEISPATSYLFEDGRWKMSTYPAMRDDGALRDLNALMRECERVLRRKYHYRSQLQDRMKNPSLVRLIEEEADRWMREKALRSRPEVRVDLSKLGAIRDLAAITRERLLEGTEEGAEAKLDLQLNSPDMSGMQEEDSQSSQDLHYTLKGANQDGPSEAALRVDVRDVLPENESEDNLYESEEYPSETEGLFTAAEREFLRLLLAGNGSAGAAFFRSHRILPSAFVDEINEKAYDEIGDSIVEEDEDSWHLVEDYVEDVRELLDEPG